MPARIPKTPFLGAAFSAPVVDPPGLAAIYFLSMPDNRELFLKLWQEEREIPEKIALLKQKFGDEAGRMAEAELGIPFSLFNSAGIIGPEESLIIPGGEFNVPFDIKIEPGGELVISPGTTLKFAKEKGILCYGLLRIIGNPESRIVLDAVNPEDGWAGVRVEGPDTWGSILSLCDIKNARGVVYPGEESTFGGGLVIADTKIIKVHNCRITNCSADYGGALFAAGCVDLELVSNTFMDCQARVGAGVALAECVGVALESNKIYKNKGSEASTGAGVMITDCQNAIMVGNDIRNNSCNAGAGTMILGSHRVFLEENLFFQNTAEAGSEESSGDANGGGLAVAECKSIDINKCQFIANTADAGGGFIVMRSTGIRVVDNIITENSAAGSEESSGGGAFFGDVSDTRLERNRFENNFAPMGGGFVALYSPRFTAVSNIIARNTGRTGGGGSTLFECNNAVLSDNEFSSNAGFQGGGLFVNSCARIKIESNRFRANHAGPQEDSAGGGLAVISSKRASILKNEFRDNVSVIAGALVVVQCKNPTVKSNHFVTNKGVAGIVAFMECEGGKLERNSFVGNEVMSDDVVIQSDSEISQTDNSVED